MNIFLPFIYEDKVKKNTFEQISLYIDIEPQIIEKDKDDEENEDIVIIKLL